MAKQPFVRTANFTDISKKLKPIAGMIGQNQALGNIPQLATAMSSNEQILKANPAVPSLATTGKSATQIGSGFLAEDKRELNSDLIAASKAACNETRCSDHGQCSGSSCSCHSGFVGQYCQTSMLLWIKLLCCMFGFLRS